MLLSHLGQRINANVHYTAGQGVPTIIPAHVLEFVCYLRSLPLLNKLQTSQFHPNVTADGYALLLCTPEVLDENVDLET